MYVIYVPVWQRHAAFPTHPSGCLTNTPPYSSIGGVRLTPPNALPITEKRCCQRGCRCHNQLDLFKCYLQRYQEMNTSDEHNKRIKIKLLIGFLSSSVMMTNNADVIDLRTYV